MASGASGPRAISSNSIMPATPKGSFSRISCASPVLVAFMMRRHRTLGLEVPLLDLPSEMVPNRGADLEWQDGGDRLGARRLVALDSRTTSITRPGPALF